MTVGLIGYGEIGSKVTKLLHPFGCQILVCDPYKTLDDVDSAGGVQMVSFDELLTRSDVVSLHARVTPETTGFINAQSLARMKPGAFFINTARGPMVDYSDLYEALNGGHLRGAMLETFGVEPIPAGDRLLALPNVTLTPHIAGASMRTVYNAANAAAEEVRRYLSGIPPLNAC